MEESTRQRKYDTGLKTTETAKIDDNTGLMTIEQVLNKTFILSQIQRIAILTLTFISLKDLFFE